MPLLLLSKYKETLVIPVWLLPVPEAVSFKLVIVVGELLWLVNWICRTVTLEAPGIWVELAGDEEPTITWTTAGVEVEVVVAVAVAVGLLVEVKLFVKV